MSSNPRRFGGDEDDQSTGRRTNRQSRRRSIDGLEGGSRTPRRGGRVLDDTEDSSVLSGRSGRVNSAGALNHEDEIERIREQRARRLQYAQKNRLEGGEDGGDKEGDDHPGEDEDEKRRREARERRRAAREGRARGEISPSKHQSTPLMSRRALEDSGLARKDRPRRDAHSPTRTRTQLPEPSSPKKEDGSSYSRSARRFTGNEEDGSSYSRYSRMRRERAGEEGETRRDRVGDIEERLEARRARRIAEGEAGKDGDSEGDASLISKLRRERRKSMNSIMESTGDDSADKASAENESWKTDKGGERGPRRRAPPRSRSADQDLYDMNTMTKEMDSTDREARRRDRQQSRLQSELRSTDLTTRLRERREARAAEREANARGDATSRRGADVERTLTRRRSGDEILAQMALESKKTAAVDDELEKVVENLADLELGSGEDPSGEDASDWCVRINVVSAVDLPLKIVPNMPLCPVLKFGLVKVPTETSLDPSKVITRKLGNNSIEKVQSARVRTTTSKILSKRDNGTVDFHQEIRWDGVRHPEQVALCVELSARAAKPSVKLSGSPPPLSQHDAFLVPVVESNSEHSMASSRPTDENGDPIRGVNRNNSGEGGGGLRALWRNATNRKAVELEAAENAAAIARMIIEREKEKNPDSVSQNESGPSAPVMKLSVSPQSDYNVGMQSTVQEISEIGLTEDVRLGSLVIPLTNLPLDRAKSGNEAARLEQWYQVESMNKSIAEPAGGWKKPTLLMEISFSSPEILDDSEDELEDDAGEDIESDVLKTSKRLSTANPSFGRRSTIDARGLLKNSKPAEEAKIEDPVLEPGVIDFVAVVGCRDIGNQKNDSGHKGWVDSSPESVIFEQFPPDNEFHQKSGRNALLPEMVQWFCFPEGNKLWRGTSPPSHTDLNLKRFSASSPPNIASSIATFDACLNCTTSFSWFVIASNSDEYGSKLVKTYGAVIRFYAPAPTGIDPTQEDFAQTVMGNQSPVEGSVKRLWVPVGICLTSNLPIIGVMEAILLRLCEELTVKVDDPPKLEEIQSSLTSLILNFQKPIAGAVNCSVPFLSGNRFLLSLPPPTGLPPLPHGRAVVSVCRLLGADGLNFLLSAVLTESKILIHSQDVADIAMVAEVVTALTYPFSWSLPYIPILPIGMLEFVEAPLSYILGIPTCNLQLIDPYALEDVVVIDLDNGFSAVDYSESRRSSRIERKAPTPLPTTVAMNISRAWYKLLRAEEEMEEEFGHAMLGDQTLPRLEAESLAEREFRISVAIEICSLLRGYDQCLGPVFNRDKFLKISPALFEDRANSRSIGGALTSRASVSKSMSPRSKRFLSLLVNTQNFQQLLESLESDEISLFHEIMEIFDDSSSDEIPSAVRIDNGSNKREKALNQLAKTLQKSEDIIPTFLVDQASGLDSEDTFDDDDDDIFFDDMGDGFQDFDVLRDESDVMPSIDGNITSPFSEKLLAPIDLKSANNDTSDSGTSAVSMEYIQKLETNPWEYRSFINAPVTASVEVKEKVKLRDAIGERRFRAWEMAQDQKAEGEVDLSFMQNSLGQNQGVSIDLTSLITSATSDTSETVSLSSTSSSLRTSTLTPEQQRVADAKNRDIIRRCLDRANVGSNKRYDENNKDSPRPANPFLENGRDLMAEAEKAIQNPSAQKFFLSILAQRSRLESQRVARTMRHRQSSVVSMSSVSRLGTVAFECLIRLSCAMLDSCMEYNEYEPAYRLLTYTAGFIMVVENDEDEDREGSPKSVLSMTSRIGLHPIFADLGVWQAVMALHLLDRHSEKKSELISSNLSDDDSDDDDEEDEDEIEYEAAVATLYEMVGYGIPGEELCRFAMKVCEEHGWFCDDRGRQLLMLARRISVRRDQADLGGAGDTGDIDMVRRGQEGVHQSSAVEGDSATLEENDHKWVDIGWCHPAAPSSVIKPDTKVTDEFMKRSPVTALAAFDSSVVVSGGLDGSVFFAHSIPDDEFDPEVRGIHLDWGSASRAGIGSSSDGEYGVGAVSCLAAAYGSGHDVSMSSKKDSGGDIHRDDILAAMEGSRVVAGTTAGDLRVWSVQDVYSAISLGKKGDNSDGLGSGNALTRLKFSLRGRALSGHRGGVTCIDVPSHVYRPDALVTGGADGLIKLWSLRAPTTGRRSVTSTSAHDHESSGQHRGRGGDALSILRGHNGRIMCIQTAWHGDRLLSGGADRTLRIWDLAGSGGKCLHTLSGHFGWITMVKYWGPNTIISASTDRSIALWDARVRSSPLFVLRHHHSPISDLIVGSRTDPLMVSAAADCTIATWDFRALSGSTSSSENSTDPHRDNSKTYQVVRQPAATMKHGFDANKETTTGAVRLARGFKNSTQSILSVGSDAIVREWNMATGDLMSESSTGHIDEITSFNSFGQRSDDTNIGIVSPPDVKRGSLTSSLDGTIRMRRYVKS